MLIEGVLDLAFDEGRRRPWSSTSRPTTSCRPARRAIARSSCSTSTPSRARPGGRRRGCSSGCKIRGLVLVPGTRLGPYEILSPSGAGGMGEVYKAKDTRLDRTVAVKVLPPHLSSIAGGPRALRARGADDLAALASAHLRALRRRRARGTSTTSSWSYLEGETLADAARAAGRCRSSRRCASAIEIADALDAAHRQRASSTAISSPAT